MEEILGFGLKQHQDRNEDLLFNYMPDDNRKFDSKENSPFRI